MLDVMPKDGTATVKIQADVWELNICAPVPDLAKLRRVRTAVWSARTCMAIGTCAGVPVFWCHNEGQVTILIGQDSETWDVAFIIPAETTDEIVEQLEHEAGTRFDSGDRPAADMNPLW